MKAKYFVMATLCCAILSACQKNEPEVNNNGQSTTEVIEEVNDLVDGLGTIVETTTQDDGSVVMKDDQGNTITKDKDGNITIVMKDGETIYIDNSIKEDKTAAKDKWFHSTWRSPQYNSIEPIWPSEDEPRLVSRLRELGFEIGETNISFDTVIVEQKQYSDYTIYFRYTTGSLQQKDTVEKHTITETRNYLKITLFPGEVGDGEVRYALVIQDNIAFLYERYYYYDVETEKYELDGEWLIEMYDRINDNNEILLDGGIDKNTQTEILSTKTQTTYYNYRRISDTQMAVSNNSGSFILKEIAEDEIPEMEVYDMEGNRLLTIELVAF